MRSEKCRGSKAGGTGKRKGLLKRRERELRTVYYVRPELAKMRQDIGLVDNNETVATAEAAAAETGACCAQLCQAHSLT